MRKLVLPFTGLVILVIMLAPALPHRAREYPTVLSVFGTQDKTQELFSTAITELANLNGEYSIYAKRLNSDTTYTSNEQVSYDIASLYKLPVAVAVLKAQQEGYLSMDKQLVYSARHYRESFGSVNQSYYGSSFTISELFTKMLKESDTSAQIMLEEELANYPEIVRTAFPNGGESTFSSEYVSDVVEMGRYMSWVFESDYLSQTQKAVLYEALSGTQFDYLFAKGLNITFANKVGLYEGQIHVCGVTQNYTVVVCVMSKNSNDATFLEVAKALSRFINNLYIVG